MGRRLLRILAFPTGLILLIPGIIQWVFTGRNIGMELFEFMADDDY